MDRMVYALVAISGACGLMYEILWIRTLGLHFGTSTPAIALVTATFMGGLALGNAWLGARADRLSHPLRFYARMELGIAIFGAAISLALSQAGGLFDALSRAAEAAGPFAFAVRAGAIVALLLAPTTLMGGTLPVLSRALLRDARTGSTVGGLYAWNTLGAVIGVLLPDFALVPFVGAGAVVVVAAAGNLAVAAIASRLARSAPPLPVLDVQTAASHAQDDRSLLLPATVLTAISGFCGMALELLWSRTLGHFTASLVTSFSVLLAVYLVMLALGALAVRRVADESPQPLAVAGLLFGACGLATLATIALSPAWRELVRALWPYAQRDDGLVRAAFAAVLHALYLEGVPCLLLGAAFPFVAKALVRADAAGSSTGRLFVVNTLAGVLGSIVAAFVWLPAIGQQDSYSVICTLLALGALTSVFASQRSAARTWSGACAALVLVAVVLLPSDRLRRASFRAPERILQLHEGAATTAAAAARYTYGQLSDLELLTPGVAMSDTSLGARRYMGMMAHAAVLASAGAETAQQRALLICYGVGNTARSLLSHPSVGRLDVVDISREVLALAPVFARVQGRNPLADPRTRVFVDDGRHHLVARDARYDVITAEPPPPNHAGVANLYSRELYALAKRRLTPRGVITQWLPVFELSNADVHTMIAAFTAELPHTALLYGHSQHFILIGSQAPLAIDPARATAMLRDASVRADLEKSGIGDLADIYGSVLQTDAELRKRVARAAPLSDDRPTIEYPWQPLDEARNWGDMLGTNATRGATLLPRGVHDAGLLDAIRRSLRATDLVVRVSNARDMALELEARGGARPPSPFERALVAALVERPGDEALLAMLGVDTETVAAASRLLLQPGARELLALPQQVAHAQGQGDAYAMLRQAQLTLDRRARFAPRMPAIAE